MTFIQFRGTSVIHKCLCLTSTVDTFYQVKTRLISLSNLMSELKIKTVYTISFTFTHFPMSYLYLVQLEIVIKTGVVLCKKCELSIRI